MRKGRKRVASGDYFYGEGVKTHNRWNREWGKFSRKKMKDA
jgi:hypothetical protein